jgi:Fe-S cluster assembly protein SufD
MDGGFLASQAGTAGAGLAWPSPRDEAFRYTPLRALAARALPIGDAVAATRVVDPVEGALPGARAARLVFVHGAWRKDLSDLGGLDPGIAITDGAPVARAEGRDAFEALNRLHARPVRIRVAPGVAVQHPLELVFLTVGTEADLAWYARVEIDVGAGASLTLVEHHRAAGDPAHVGNVAMALALADGARVSHLTVDEAGLRETRLGATEVELAAASRYDATVLALGGALARRGLAVALAGPGAGTTLRGAAALGGRQHGEMQIEVRHAVGETTSDVQWRAAAAGRSRAVFRGRIGIAAGADGSRAALDNRNLLLSPHAEVDTRPELEIDTDEVEASHGATVGQLDDAALFYLRSRGVCEVEARAMLTQAFCQVPLDRAGDPLLTESLSARLGARLAQLNGGGGG